MSQSEFMGKNSSSDELESMGSKWIDEGKLIFG